jgi:hypothetical protein
VDWISIESRVTASFCIGGVESCGLFSEFKWIYWLNICRISGFVIVMHTSSGSATRGG